jgi:hypothetical protein
MRRFFAAVVLLVAASSALACAIVGGTLDRISIEAEQAIIVWDEKRKVQHFIRRATFDGKATAHFGFLVPTPTQPQLAEADEAPFLYLAQLTTPENVKAAASAAKVAASAPDRVRVLERKKVAGLDAAVLEARDPRALDRWLKANGYVSSRALLEWYGPYVAAGWKITAFKIDPEDGRPAPAPVRMSFQTDVAFFPYREPPSEAKNRLLRVYFIADGRHDAALDGDARWPGRAVWSRSLDGFEVGALRKMLRLPETDLGDGAWLTEFVDRAAPRPAGGDLKFTRAAEQSPIKHDFEPAEDRQWWMLVVIAAVVIALVIGHFWSVAGKRNG